MRKIVPIEIRREDPGDRTQVLEVNIQAFDTDAEARLVGAIQSSADNGPIISLVAVLDQTIVGHILFTTVTVESAAAHVSLMGLGPMAVRPEHQNRGFGSQLVRQGLKACNASGAAAVFVLGHPDYYPRFGFELAAPHGLHFKGDEFAPFFMVLELRSGLLETLSGEVQYRSEFEAV